MIGVLSATLVIAILVVVILGTGSACFVCVLAGKSRPAVGWFAACLVSAGILSSILGGF